MLGSTRRFLGRVGESEPKRSVMESSSISDQLASLQQSRHACLCTGDMSALPINHVRVLTHACACEEGRDVCARGSVALCAVSVCRSILSSISSSGGGGGGGAAGSFKLDLDFLGSAATSY